MSEPLVSVVTPFRNTARYLAECIESVLTQSYADHEYILSDNCSTDGSTEIAEAYARRDPRIRLIRQPRLLSQVEHYNRALAEISTRSQYCKMVQADDYIFPQCLTLMVQCFNQSESIGLVSAYDLKRNIVRGSGFPYPTTQLSGRDMGRYHLQTGVFVFGSPTTVMYRSSIVREQQPFYDESLLHEDTEKCLQILEHWDFGFVHQILSFLRVENESISSAASSFSPDALDRYIVVMKYADSFLDPVEATALKKATRRGYYRVLARAVLKRSENKFWIYHRKGLQTIDQSIDSMYLMCQAGWELATAISNPGSTIGSVRRLLQQRRKGEGPVPTQEEYPFGP